MILSRKHNKPFHPPISMNQNLINNVNSHNYLGLTFSQDCSWHDHLELVKTKAWLRIDIMRRLKFQLDRKSLQTIYISFIRPLLEYADVVWDNCTQQEANEFKMKPLALLREQLNLHQFNFYCLTQGGKVSHREEKNTNSSSSLR